MEDAPQYGKISLISEPVELGKRAHQLRSAMAAMLSLGDFSTAPKEEAQHRENIEDLIAAVAAQYQKEPQPC